MKSTTLLLILCVITLPVMAQKNIEKHIDFGGKEKLGLNIQIADSIFVHTWNKPEIYAKVLVNVNHNTDNEAYLVSFDENGKEVKIAAKFKDDFFKGKKHDCLETEIVWELYIPDNTGFSVETIDGNIIIDGMTTGVVAKSISGFIDLAMANNRSANLKLRTISGTFYTDLDIKANTSSSPIPQVISLKLNDGGDPVNLETISGDIFVRKSK